MNQRYLRSKKLSLKIFDQTMSETHGWVGGTRKYSEQQIQDLLSMAAFRQSSIEDTSKYLIEKSEGYGSVPSGDTVIRSLESIHGQSDLEEIEKFVSTKLHEQARKIPHLTSWSITPAMRRRNSRKKLASKGLILAIDITNIEYHGKEPVYDNKGRLLTPVGRGSKGKKRKVFRYATACIVFDYKKVQPPITVGFTVSFKGQSRQKLVEKLLDQVYKLFLPSVPKIRFLLLDGGFISKAMCKYLDNLEVNYLIRGRYLRKRRYPKKQRFKTTVKGYPVMAYKLKIKRADGKRQTAIFVGSRSKRYGAKKVLKIYRLRFRIENTYRHAKAWKIRTCVQDFQTRVVLWGFSVFLELIWEIVRYFLQSDGDEENGNNYHLRQRRFAEIWLDHLKEQVQPALYPIVLQLD